MLLVKPDDWGKKCLEEVRPVDYTILIAKMGRILPSHGVIEYRHRSTSILSKTSNCKQRLVWMEHHDRADRLSIQKLHFCVEEQSHF